VKIPFSSSSIVVVLLVVHIGRERGYWEISHIIAAWEHSHVCASRIPATKSHSYALK